MKFDIEFTPELVALIVAVGLIIIIILAVIIFLYSRKPHSRRFRKKWTRIKSKLPKEDQWVEALVEADNLLDAALRKKNYTGKTVGEKLVKAEKIFTDKDEVWFGHKLSKKAQEKPDFKIKKADMKRALLGLQKGLKDLDVL